jgi:hypothetical protein
MGGQQQERLPMGRQQQQVLFRKTSGRTMGHCRLIANSRRPPVSTRVSLRSLKTVGIPVNNVRQKTKYQYLYVQRRQQRKCARPTPKIALPRSLRFYR